MIDLRIKKLFFDRKAVINAVDKAKRAVLSKAGAFIRVAARHSIRKRKGSASPGKPPYSHTGLLRRFIFFGYDRAADSVVIGPAKLSKPTDAPHALEFGGTTTATERRRGRLRKRKVRVRPHPYMGPALEKERPKLPALWRNSVKGS